MTGKLGGGGGFMLRFEPQLAGVLYDRHFDAVDEIDYLDMSSLSV
jgi:hypothetical protein